MFWYQGYAGLIEQLKRVPSYLKIFVKISISSMKPSETRVFYVKRLLTTNLVSLMAIQIFNLFSKLTAFKTNLTVSSKVLTLLTLCS